MYLQILRLYAKMVLNKYSQPKRRLDLMPLSDFITVNEASSILKVTTQHVRTLIRNENLPAERVGSQWLISKSALEAYISDNDVMIEPDDRIRESVVLPKIVAMSFFSGAMGLDIGMKNGGIDAVLACEFNKFCRMTIAKNNPDIALIGDIEKYSSKEIMKMANLPEGTKVDVIFGGPPCQAFSTAGNRKGFEDARGNVFLRYLEIVGEIKPTYVVIENVRGLLSATYPYKEFSGPIKGGALLVILDKLKELGYTVSFNLYNAANYGAPQIRERVVMIGKLGKEKVAYLTPTHSENGNNGLEPWRTLKDALDELPKDTEHHYIEFPEKRLRFYRILKEGQYWKDLPPDLQVEAMGSKLQLGGGKTGFLRRLKFDRPSPTLVTNPTMPATDLCHPTLDRPLSVEEYSRIQGFPLDWKICGPVLEQYKQIGNAVPIRLGEAIARTIINDMNGTPDEHHNSYEFSRYKNTSDVTWCSQMEAVLAKISATNNAAEQLTLFD